MMDINPGSEDFFYWDPEKLKDYQETERSEQFSEKRVKPAAKTVADSSDFLSSITAIIKNKGAV